MMRIMSFRVESSSAAVKMHLSCIFIFPSCPHVCTCTHACLCVGALTVDLQYFGGLLRCLCECHMVHFASVGHSIIISVHMQLQRTPYCKGLPTCVDLLSTFGESCVLSKMQHIYLWRCDGHTPT